MEVIMKRTNGARVGRHLWLGVLLAVLAGGWVGCGKQQNASAGRDSVETMARGEDAKEGGDARGAAETPRRHTEAHTLPAGTTFVTSLQSTISTGKNHVGDPIRLRTTESKRVDGVDVVPAGSTIRGQVTHIDPAGRIAGGAELTLRFTELILPNGKSYPIAAEPLRLHGKGEGKHSALQIGGGAVAGGVLGGILGGKGGVGKGAAAGAVVGTGVAVATKGKQIVLPAGQRIRVTLESPIRVSGPVTS
jgi:hypothetical protein